MPGSSGYIVEETDLQLRGPCSSCSDLVVVRPDQTVDLIVGCGLGVRVTVFGQSFAGVPVTRQPFLIQMNVDSRVQLHKKPGESSAH